ncbi:unnamed protein product, partial [Callosobruchus maculatus]
MPSPCGDCKANHGYSTAFWRLQEGFPHVRLLRDGLA